MEQMSLINPSTAVFSDNILCSLAILDYLIDSELKEVRRCQAVLCSVEALSPPSPACAQARSEPKPNSMLRPLHYLPYRV